MKYGAFILVLVLNLSCSTNEESKSLPAGLPQIWKLSSLNLGLSGEVVSDDEIPYLETIELQMDSTFVKIRLRNDETESATGTFRYQERNGDNYIILYNSETNDLIGNCTRSLEEWFRLDSETTMFGGGLPCDRPGLGYERIE